ncbi:uncharacterized protein GGS25DRAFT_256215 [Hypoxylon fragiforme]|uniref:uncharacterized protein n=1 Tax=Hypoxylon fragiforme TaxID=63214 RepID=UPI0020C742BC|nr:uncharacterized protein GGS25DRAFT_256215 [Hypoxylon fragiforme]KAI2610310.1 hypothetical protein GGS25DRAFT_256215 [Hypoxylon fragiforme]
MRISLKPFASSPCKANDLLLQGVSKATEQILMPLSSGGSYWADEQEFTTLRRIVRYRAIIQGSRNRAAGASRRHRQTGRSRPQRSTVSWAAARGPEGHISLLLSHGATPNILDVQLAGPVAYSADRSHDILALLLGRWAEYSGSVCPRRGREAADGVQ